MMTSAVTLVSRACNGGRSNSAWACSEMPASDGMFGTAKATLPTPAGYGMTIADRGSNCVGSRPNVPNGGTGVDAVPVERTGSATFTRLGGP